MYRGWGRSPVYERVLKNTNLFFGSLSNLGVQRSHKLFQVHKFMIAPKDFSLPGGELPPTMKLKRHTVMEMYEKKIQQVIVLIL